MDFKSIFFAWVSSILDHWGALMTGGILMALVALLRDRFPKYVTWTRARRLAFAFLLFAIFQSWEQEYKSRLGRERDLIASNTRVDYLSREAINQQQRLDARCDLQLASVRQDSASKEAVAQTLQKQNRDQQSTIDGCLSQAMKLLTPEEQKTTPNFFDNNNSTNVAIRTARWILLTNEALTPVRMVIQCDKYLESASAHPIGGGAMMGSGSSRLARNAWENNIQSPAWTPAQPFIATVSYRGDEQIVCSFVAR